jgi:competence protein ComEA
MINTNLLFLQAVAVSILVLLILGFKSLVFTSSKTYTQEDLRLNINKATLKELIAVPYIGKKTAWKIIKLREKRGYFKELSILKKIRNFKKFKPYIKVR